MAVRSLLLSALILGSGVCWADNSNSLSAAVRSFDNDAPTAGYRYARTDLNDDGYEDAVVLLKGDFCGSAGCTLLVFVGSKTGLKLLSSSTISNEPIGMLNERIHDWRTLLVTSRGVGPVLMRFDGAKYPLNPSMQTPATKEQVAGATVLKFEDAPPANR